MRGKKGWGRKWEASSKKVTVYDACGEYPLSINSVTFCCMETKESAKKRGHQAHSGWSKGKQGKTFLNSTTVGGGGDTTFSGASTRPKRRYRSEERTGTT